jgi:light-regulated signal transduction histidine kinase (bacteriophytochrome)
MPTVAGDKAQLVQLFQNLMGNAIKFRRQDTPRIDIDAVKRNDEWVFCVRDNGIGIKQEHAQRIFVVFQRLHARDEYTGTGIGLSICQRIVQRHGGRIWVDSEPGQGSAFYFTLPV